jgi:hypothetical protein
MLNICPVFLILTLAGQGTAANPDLKVLSNPKGVVTKVNPTGSMLIRRTNNDRKQVCKVILYGIKWPQPQNRYGAISYLERHLTGREVFFRIFATYPDHFEAFVSRPVNGPDGGINATLVVTGMTDTSKPEDLTFKAVRELAQRKRAGMWSKGQR